MSDLKTDVIQLRVLIDGSPARKELAELTQEAVALQQGLKGLKKGTDEYVAANARLGEIGTRQEVLRKEIGLTSLSQKELNAELGRARAAFIVATPKSEGWVQAKLRIDELKNALADLRDQNRIDAQVWEQVRSQYKLVELDTKQLALESNRLKAIIANPATSSADYAKAARDLALVTDRTQQLTNANRISAEAWEIQRKELKLTDLSLEQLGLESTRLKAKLQTMVPSDPGLGRTRAELIAVEQRAKALESGLGPMGRAWGLVKGQVMGATAVLGTFLAGGAIIQGFRSIVTGASKVSDELADIQKVTGLSADQVKRLNHELSQIDTRTATSELRGIAIGLGQVGEAVTAASVGAINKISLALGTEFGTNAQEITNTISVLRNNLSDLKSGDYAKDVGEIGNAILVLGQAGLATAPVVSDIATRISGVARQFGISSGAILGTSAAMQELGINAERGSTAYVRIISKISQTPDVFAKLVEQAGGSAKDFIKLVNTDMNAAFLTVAKAAKIAGNENTAFGAILEDLKQKGVGVSELLSKAGANTELFAKKIDLASEALTNQNAINAQAALAEDNLAGQLEKLGKEWNKLTTSTTVLDWLGNIVAGLRGAIQWIRNNADALVFLAKIVLNAAVAWGTYSASLIIKNKWEQIATTVTKAFAGVQALLTGNVGRAAAAFKVLTTAIKENPFGLLVTVVTTAISLFESFKTEMSSVTSEMVQQTAELNRLYLQTLRTNQGSEERKKLIDQLKATYPEYLGQLNSETATNTQLAAAIKEVNQQVINKIVLQEQEQKLTALREAALQAGVDQTKTELQGLDLIRTLAEKYGVDAQKATEGATNSIEQLEQFRAAVIAKRKADGGSGFFKESSELSQLILSLGPLKTIYAQRNKIVEDAANQKQRIEDNLLKLSAGDAKGGEEVITEEIETLNKLKAELIELEEARGNINAKDKKKLATNLARINALKKEIAAIDGTSDAENRREEKAQENLDALLAQYRIFQEDLANDQSTADERALADLDRKQAEELLKVKQQQAKLIAAKKLTPEQAATDIGGLEDQQAQDRANLIEQQGDKRAKASKDANDKIQKLLGEEHNAELQADVKFFEDEIQKGKEKNENVEELERKHKDALLKLYEQNAKDLIQAEVEKYTDLIALARKKLEDFDKVNATQGITPDKDSLAERRILSNNLIALEKSQAAAIKRINDERRRQEKAAEFELTRELRAETIRRLQNFANYASAFGEVADSITQYIGVGEQIAEQRADADGVRTEAEIDNINRLKEQQRAAALVTIAVQGAIAIAKGVASAMSVPFPGNLVAVATTIATVIGLIAQARALLNSADGGSVSPAVQTAVNAAPQGERGMAIGKGVITQADGGAVLQGPRHTDDGLMVLNPKTGKPVAEVEGGELMLVLSRAATAANADLIPAMLKASKAGKRLDFFAPPPQVNTLSAQRAMRVVHMAEGGAIGNTEALQRSHSTAASTDRLEALMGRAVDLLSKVAVLQKQNVEATKDIRSIKAVLALNPSYDRKQEEWQALKDQYSAGKKSA